MNVMYLFSHTSHLIFSIMIVTGGLIPLTMNQTDPNLKILADLVSNHKSIVLIRPFFCFLFAYLVNFLQ